MSIKEFLAKQNKIVKIAFVVLVGLIFISMLFNLLIGFLIVNKKPPEIEIPAKIYVEAGLSGAAITLWGIDEGSNYTEAPIGLATLVKSENELVITSVLHIKNNLIESGPNTKIEIRLPDGPKIIVLPTDFQNYPKNFDLATETLKANNVYLPDAIIYYVLKGENLLLVNAEISKGNIQVMNINNDLLKADSVIDKSSAYFAVDQDYSKIMMNFEGVETGSGFYNFTCKQNLQCGKLSDSGQGIMKYNNELNTYELVGILSNAKPGDALYVPVTKDLIDKLMLE